MVWGSSHNPRDSFTFYMVMLMWGAKEAEKKKIEFKRAYRKENLKVGIFGLPKTGKTYFSLTAPEPIAVIDTELGTAPVAIQHFPEKDIRIYEVDVLSGSGDIDPDMAIRNIEMAVRDIVLDENIKTVVLDSGTDLWSFMHMWLDRVARKTKIGTIVRTEWGMANARYRAIVQKLRAMKKHLIFTGHAKPVYTEDGKETNMFKPDWQRDTAYWFDVIVETAKKATGKGWEFQLIVRDVRFMQVEPYVITLPTWQKLVEYFKKIGIKIELG